MADANLLEALAKQGKGGCLSDLKLFGRVRCAIKRPDILGSKLNTVEEGAFAILDVYALKCLKQDYFVNYETGSSQSVYFTKGSMVIYIDSTEWVGKDVKVAGISPKVGVKVRQQFNHKTPYDGITALVFKSLGYDYIVVPNSLTELGTKDVDLRLTPLEDFVVKIQKEKSGVIEYPITLDSIISYNGTEDYEVLEDFKETAKHEYKELNGKLDVTKIDLNLTYHLSSKEVSPIHEDVQEEINVMSEKRKEYAKDLKETLKNTMQEDNVSPTDIAISIRNAFVDNVVSRFNENIGSSGIKASVYVKELIQGLASKSINDEDNEKGEKKASQEAVNRSIEVLTTLIQIEPSVLKNTYIEDVQLPLLRKHIDVALLIISIATGISMESLRANYTTCSRVAGLSYDLWFYTLINNPYALEMIGSSLGVVNCDRVYFSFSRVFTSGILSKESGDLRSDLLYINTLKNVDDKNTMVLPYALSSQQYKYPTEASRFLSQNKFPIKKDLFELICTICGRDISLAEKQINYLQNVKWFTNDRTNNLIERGIVNLIDDYVIAESDLEKEFLIYDTLIKKGSQTTGITDPQIQGVLEKFEEEKGFKLEVLQRDALKLCKFKAGVLSGGAGSGKTTTSDAMKMCLEEYMKDYKIIYATPTGKASRRLAEVVHAPVKTIHSQFGVGMYSESCLTTVKKKYQSNPSKKIYILDEMAMCSTSLLYEVVRNLSDNDLVYFLGDIKQLVPIGKGNPFNLLMKILPCVELGVSKRAAEGSNVNYNTTLINHKSDDDIVELYYDDSSFIGMECQDADIPLSTLKAWKGLMDGSLTGKVLNEEDIQVISGYAKPDLVFSSTALNLPLQQFLRKQDKLLFRHVDRDFYENDRVIHVKVNSYGIQRYMEVEKNVYRAVAPLGVMNGEMGTLVGIERSDVIMLEQFKESDLDTEPIYSNLSEEDKEKLLKLREEREDAIRDDSKIRDPKTYFVKVKVYDVDLGVDVYIMYLARLNYKEDVLVLSGGDLGFLDLAYALTTHKMQGSQSKAVILPFGSSCNPMFINRNMINTMVTRSQDIVVMIGDIKGPTSAVNRGRQNPSKIETDDLLSLLCE